MKKTAVFLRLAIFLLVLAGCTGTASIPTSNTLEKAASQYSSKKIKEYDSPYTAMYQNKDGNYDLYIFSSPVQYLAKDGYAPIDNRLRVSDRAGFLYENEAGDVKSFFPKAVGEALVIEKGEQSISLRLNQTESFKEAQQCTFENMYGSRVEAVKYEGEKADIYYYPTNLGIRMEVQRKTDDAPTVYEFTTLLGGEDAAALEDESYIRLYQAAKLTGIFYSALSMGQSDAPYQKNHAQILQAEGEQANSFTVRYQLGADGQGTAALAKGDAALEFYANKMPDSTAYEQAGQYPYLSDCYQLNDAQKGAANHYLRFRINYFLTTMANNISSAQYHVNVFNINGKEALDQIQLRKVQEQWSSTGLTWANKGAAGEEIGRLTADQVGNTYFDVTGFVKECVNDPAWMSESLGAFISGTEKNAWLATSDHALYSPYLKITFKERPSYFEAKNNINNVNF